MDTLDRLRAKLAEPMTGGQMASCFLEATPYPTDLEELKLYDQFEREMRKKYPRSVGM